MAKKDTEAGRATEPRDTDPSVGADDRVEELRGTADDESDEFDDDGEDDELEDEDEADEGPL
ncbi:MAG: hypothetical protein M3468_12770 [Acidobacteriota bacterium]|nr:hypothetical protein [Acidobacteriota bacterium]